MQLGLYQKNLSGVWGVLISSDNFDHRTHLYPQKRPPLPELYSIVILNHQGTLIKHNVIELHLNVLDLASFLMISVQDVPPTELFTVEQVERQDFRHRKHRVTSSKQSRIACFAQPSGFGVRLFFLNALYRMENKPFPSTKTWPLQSK